MPTPSQAGQRGCSHGRNSTRPAPATRPEQLAPCSGRCASAWPTDPAACPWSARRCGDAGVNIVGTAGVPRHRLGDRRAGGGRPRRLDPARPAAAGRAGGRPTSSTPTAARRACCSTRRPATSRRRGSSSMPRPASRRSSRSCFDAEPEPIDGSACDSDGPGGRRRGGAGAPRGAVHGHRAHPRGRPSPRWSPTCCARDASYADRGTPDGAVRGLAPAPELVADTHEVRAVVEVGRGRPGRARADRRRRGPPARARDRSGLAPTGLGTRLLKEAARLSAALGDDEMTLVTTADNQRRPAAGPGVRAARPDPDVRGRAVRAGARARAHSDTEVSARASGT